jgi:hypothetical protein
VNTALRMDIGPGGKAQRLLRDDKNFHITHAEQAESGYQIGSDIELSILIQGVDC